MTLANALEITRCKLDMGKLGARFVYIGVTGSKKNRRLKVGILTSLEDYKPVGQHGNRVLVLKRIDDESK